MNRRELLQTQIAGLLADPGSSTSPNARPSGPADTIPQLCAYTDVRSFGVVADGNVDDTVALQSAFKANADHGLSLLIPHGVTIKITDYVEIFSNTVLLILGTLQLTNRRSGLFTNGAENVAIYGNKIGRIQDAVVTADFRWNKSINYAPAIHIRSGSTVLVDGLNISYCSSGVFISCATKNWLPGVDWTLTQAAPNDVRVQNCKLQYCEMSGVALLVGTHRGFYGNYIFRCGDGGLWMMGSQGCEVVGNHRISPKTIIADIGKYGYNSRQHPTTWNDEQGIEFQSSFDLLIADNVVENFCFYGIDVKEDCNRVMITRNRVRYCEQASIIVREGDAGNVGGVGKVSIIGNFITNHGYSLISNTQAHASVAAISVSSCFTAEIIDNVIYSYRLTPGILCQGPGRWQAGADGRFPKNPHQASVTVSGNSVDFTAPMAMDTEEAQFTAATLGAILIQGFYTSIKCDGNHIRTDRFDNNDARANSSPAIMLSYVSNGPMKFYPTAASINNNEVAGWGNSGITVVGLPALSVCGLTVNGNVIACAGATGITLTSTNSAVCTGNNVAQSNPANDASFGILLRGEATALNGVICSGNSIGGPDPAGGGHLVAHAIGLVHCAEINCTNNAFINCTGEPIFVENSTGNIVTSGSTSFPRSGASPDGAVISYHRGEMYYDSINGKWWAATTFASKAWTALSH